MTDEFFKLHVETREVFEKLIVEKLTPVEAYSEYLDLVRKYKVDSGESDSPESSTPEKLEAITNS